MHLLPVPHINQRQQTDCLAACAAMVLAFWQMPIPYGRLLSVLNISRYGAPSTNIRNLTQLGVRISYREGDLETLRVLLGRGQPCIMFVRTGELPYWSVDTGHAIVIVGYDDLGFHANDPASIQAPRYISDGDLALAWLEFDCEFAVSMLYQGEQ